MHNKHLVPLLSFRAAFCDCSLSLFSSFYLCCGACSAFHLKCKNCIQLCFCCVCLFVFPNSFYFITLHPFCLSLSLCVCTLYMFIYITCGISLCLVFSSFPFLFAFVFSARIYIHLWICITTNFYVFVPCYYFSKHSQYEGKSISFNSVDCWALRTKPIVHIDKNLDDEM